MNDVTRDLFLRGRLVLSQPRRGARAGLDPLLLAAFARTERPRPGAVVDLGAGTGIVGLAVAALAPVTRLALVELQPDLVAIARANAASAGQGATVVEGDLRRAARLGLGAHAFDLAVANPPYTAADAGARPLDPTRARSRQELTATIDDVARAAATLVTGNGRLAVVFPAGRLVALTTALAGRGFGPRVLRSVHSTADAPARLVLVLAQKGYRGALTIRPPMVVHAGGAYTPEVAALLDGDA